MAPLLPVILTFALSMVGPFSAVAWDDDESTTSYRAYGYSPYGYGSSSSNLEPQQDAWRREAAEADQRNREAVERRNQPPVYESSPANPNAPFGVWSPDGRYAVCQKGGSTIYCW